MLFAGSIRADSLDYSHGVRQQLWRMFGDSNNPQVLIHEGGMHPEQYARMLNSSKFCLAPSGYGWGIRLNYYMVTGRVPVIIQVRRLLFFTVRRTAVLPAVALLNRSAVRCRRLHSVLFSVLNGRCHS